MRPMLASWFPEEIVTRWVPHVEFNYDGGLVTWKKPYDFIEFFIRKGAHVSEYALLSFLWIRTLSVWPFRSAAPSIIVGGALAVLYAASDEWHQSFVPGRTGHSIDVMVDSVGVGLVVILFTLTRWIRYKRKAARGA